MGEDILKNVKEDHHFLLLGGKRLKNLHELHDELESMEAHVYDHHVNSERNDFHNWVNDVHQDAKLATALKKIKHREEALKVVRSRINEVTPLWRVAPPPQKRAIATGKKFDFVGLAHKYQAVAGLIGVLMLFGFVGLGLKATSITGAAVAQSSEPIAFFGGIIGVLFLLAVALYVINEKHGS